jgi:hypothetical protein
VADDLHQARLANASASLAAWLSPVGFSSATAGEVTVRLTAEVERWAEHYDYAGALMGPVTTAVFDEHLRQPDPNGAPRVADTGKACC